MNPIIAYCGIVCSNCPAYQATQAGNRAALEQVAAEWREMFNAPEITADSVICDGCLEAIGSRRAGYCSMCEIRACAIPRRVVNCAHCDDYGCEKLTGFFSHAAEARTMLESIRGSLGA